MPPVGVDRHPRRTVVVLALLSMFGPISLDLYLPSLPELAADLDASTSSAQLTITACLLGLAVGQLVAGPLSDQFGRRRPLLIGLVAYLLTSSACAFAPTIELLIMLRLLQGLAGAAGLVIAKAVARDLYEGAALLVFFARLVLISGLAPVLAPLFGGQLARVMDWRGIFLVLAAFGLLLVVAGFVGVPESLPPERRSAGGLRANLTGFGELLRDRLFLGAAFASGSPVPPCSPTSPVPRSCCSASTACRRRGSRTPSASTRSASWPCRRWARWRGAGPRCGCWDSVWP